MIRIIIKLSVVFLLVVQSFSALSNELSETKITLLPDSIIDYLAVKHLKLEKGKYGFYRDSVLMKRNGSEVLVGIVKIYEPDKLLGRMKEGFHYAHIGKSPESIHYSRTRIKKPYYYFRKKGTRFGRYVIIDTSTAEVLKKVRRKRERRINIFKRVLRVFRIRYKYQER